MNGGSRVKVVGYETRGTCQGSAESMRCFKRQMTRRGRRVPIDMEGIAPEPVTVKAEAKPVILDQYRRRIVAVVPTARNTFEIFYNDDDDNRQAARRFVGILSFMGLIR
jgi:hypothetical protein